MIRRVRLPAIFIREVGPRNGVHCQPCSSHVGWAEWAELDGEDGMSLRGSLRTLGQKGEGITVIPRWNAQQRAIVDVEALSAVILLAGSAIESTHDHPLAIIDPFPIESPYENSL
ncbi:hypothetical protein KIN20_005591 [Parelaphostrongylus tenuis]|uniref:Uncharacterized protein n=1 Tax=Parelaphostrongylus tenuis TaxID=148309 RepID=A0AAD5QHM5_PARTN|nr:hypothetical protein KIN20_005591 [Parelaphostrongylus tenuis]